MPEPAAKGSRPASTVRTFEAHGQRWQVIRQAGPEDWLGRLAGRSRDTPPPGLLFVAESGDRRFRAMLSGPIPSEARLAKLPRTELLALLEEAITWE